jgi:molecular chaperone GrpE (heat shock protein)
LTEIKELQTQIFDTLKEIPNLKARHDQEVNRLATNLKDQFREKLMEFFDKEKKTAEDEFCQPQEK